MNRNTGVVLSLLVAGIFVFWYGTTSVLSGANWYVPTATYYPSPEIQGLAIALALVFSFWGTQRLLKMEGRRVLALGIILGIMHFALKLSETDSVGTASAVFDGVRMFVIDVFAAWGVSKQKRAEPAWKSQPA